MSAWWPFPQEEEVVVKNVRKDFEKAVRRQKEAAERLKKSLERIKPFEELADVLSQPTNTPVPVKKKP